MTFNKAALAIDGATINSALVRTLAYAALSGEEGIIEKADLKVTALAVPGAGVQIAAGAAVVRNGYFPTRRQSYVVENPDVHIADLSTMFTVNGSDRDFILAITIGDKEGSQTGHPWMLAGQPALGTEATFTYVRPHLILESAWAGRTYPALALARIKIRANQTTILSTDITADLRTLARPRTKLVMANVAGPGTANPLNGGGGTPGTYERFPNVGVITVPIPSWAVKAKVSGFVEGVVLSKAGTGSLSAQIEGTALVSATTNLNQSAPTAGSDRMPIMFGGEIDVTSVQGQTKTFSVRATPSNTASKSFLTADAATAVFMQVYFEEQPV